jgi:pimeloyl-ACP methyl ester carboxylesterase
MISTAEEWFHVTFTKGLNPNLECIRLNLDPVQAVHRPLLVYVVLYLVTCTFNILLLQKVWGFTHAGTMAPGVLWGGALQMFENGLQSFKAAFIMPVEDITTKPTRGKLISYWYRSTSEKKTPLVFIHGIGAGVICYAEFIHQLSHLDRPIFLVELPYVAMRMVDNVPSAAETVKEVSEMLQRYGYDNAIFVSHSLGTGIASWVMNMAPEIVGGMVMIDPICFLLHYHNVAFNFVHRIPKTIFEVTTLHTINNTIS